MNQFDLIIDHELMAPFCEDESWQKGSCEAVLVPHSTEGVQEALRWAATHRMPVVVRGGGTGMVGGALPRSGAVLSLHRLTKIEIDVRNRWVLAQAGVLTEAINEIATPHGLWYPVDPSSLDTCTIGGNVATNAGGPRAYRYGVTGRWVLQIEGFLVDGTPFRAGSKVVKDVAGYDLKSLLIGSEGTLAVVTSILLQLVPAPPELGALILYVPEDQGPGLLDTALKHLPCWTALEYFDPLCAELLGRLTGHKAEGQVAFLLEQEGTMDDIAAELSAFVEKHCPQAHTVAGLDTAAHRKIWMHRRGMSKAMYDFGSCKFNEDIGLPVSGFEPFLAYVRQLEQEYSLKIPVFGHAGDGNLHVNVMHDPAQKEMAEQVVGKVFEKVFALEGTITGEHGVGATKLPFLERQIGAEALATMRQIKNIYDPENRLNPGKVLPESSTQS